jgi:hypothetical protein
MAAVDIQAARPAPATAPRRQPAELPEGFWYSVKHRVLGPPLVTEQLKDQRLSRPLALGVLSCDGLSSAAYGTEEILRALLPFFGLAAFSLVLPMTLLILFGVVLVVLSYREVVSVYTRAGGSYVVARENFGPRVAQVAAVALLIDYVVTVAVQTAAGSAAIVSAFPALSGIPVIGPKILLVISVVAILAMCLGNLRGIREAGRIFALPTYLFAGSLVVMIVTGAVREMTGGLPHVVPGAGTVGVGSHSGLIAFGALYIMARAFANGGSSLTGIEAVSNAVSALRPPEGRNARQILAMQGTIVAFLIAGISWLAHLTHAMPYTAGFPTILAQEADGCCTTTPRTGSPAGSAASGARWPPSSPSTSGTRSRRSTPGGPGRRLTGSRTRRPAPTRSGRCASRAGLPSRAGCTPRRSARSSTTAPCWRARSPTRPAS